VVNVLVADHAGPGRHLPLAVPHHGVEARALVGTQQLEVRRRAGRHQSLAVTLRAMLGVDLAAGVGRGLGSRRHGMRKHGSDDEQADTRGHPHGSAKTKIELCPRTAFGMLFCTRLRGPAETDCPSPVNTMTYCLPFTA